MLIISAAAPLFLKALFKSQTMALPIYISIYYLLYLLCSRKCRSWNLCESKFVLEITIWNFPFNMLFIQTGIRQNCDFLTRIDFKNDMECNKLNWLKIGFFLAFFVILIKIILRIYYLLNVSLKFIRIYLIPCVEF